jgi:FAD/FMN-containing dehydrogenase
MDRRRLLGAAAVAWPGPWWRPAVARALPPPLGELANELSGPVVARGTSGYDKARLLFNVRFDAAKPLAVAFCESALDVQKTIAWGRKHGIRIAPRTGGHSYGGYSTTPGVILDVTRMHAIHASGSTATIGAGARLVDVYTALSQYGRSIPGGSCATVGVSGLSLGGGHGFLSRKWGTASDNVAELELVTADGKRRVCNAQQNSDLYWACRGGGGGNFGVVTRWTFRTHPVAGVATFRVEWPWTQAATGFAAWQKFAPHAPDELFSVFSFSHVAGSTPRAVAVGQLLGTKDRLSSLIAPLANAGTPTAVGVVSRTYVDSVHFWAGCSDLDACHAPIRPIFAAKSDYARKPLSPTAIKTITASIAAAPTRGILLLDSYGGAINRVPKAATAFVHRDMLFSFQYLAYWSDSAEGAANVAWLRGFHAAMRPYVSGEAYVNYADPDLKNWPQAYYGSNLARLVAVKKKYDPARFFRYAQGLPTYL